MNRLKLFTAMAVLGAVTPLWGQQVFERRVEIPDPPEPPPGDAMYWVNEGSGIADAVLLHGPGVRFEGPPKTGAPYSAEAVTETVQLLSDGNRIVRENRAKVYRDSRGRTRREDTLDSVGPWAVAGEAHTRIFINDPVAGVHWILEPESKIARKMPVPKIEDIRGEAGALANVSVQVRTDGPAPRRIERREIRLEQGAVLAGGGSGEPPNVEDLGTRMIEGVQATGKKITRTIPAGQIGNERPIEVVFEQWRSDELGVDVLTKRSDPRSAETTYKLTNIQRTEPLPGLFEPPADYEIKDPGGDVFIQRIDKK